MVYLEEMLSKILARLNLFCSEYDYIDSENKKLDIAFSTEESRIIMQLEDSLKQNKEHEARLVALVNIASAHATKLEDLGEREDYDIGVLSRLAVQINNGSHNDKFAEQLFTRATYQLRKTRTMVQELYSECEQKKSILSNDINEKRLVLRKSKEQLKNEVVSYINSCEFGNFITTVKHITDCFEKGDSEGKDVCVDTDICIGTKKVKIPIPTGFESYFVEACSGVFDSSSKTIEIPVTLSRDSIGKGLLVEYKNESESIVLNGILNYVLNSLRYDVDYKQVIFFDPIRFNRSSLGILQPLSIGVNSKIDDVPFSMDEMRKKLNSLIAQINVDERKIISGEATCMPKRLLIVHNFPHAYDSTMISQIQQLYMNSLNYNIMIIATHNVSSKNILSSDSISLIKTVATCIKCDDFSFEIKDSSGLVPFVWYRLPNALPQIIKKKYIDERPVMNTGNDYAERVGINNSIAYKKGIRKLDNIPYGVDSNGNILSLDFENSNFATFICGASRSGKSTLLHTIITGLIKNNHPDDVEIWLIDFKMTEFSRYTDNLPPHVRYIILDESPELVYDIIDRLTEILIKRQNAFKGKWQKLDEVPREKYMPALLIIIDEFSVMSHIVADSLATSKENYSVKLQTLLAKGAALGMHFIFSSQGFTSGTRGLNDFSKKQIQQRIAMKTEYNEIKETLDLKSASDDDRAMMEQLPVHHALVRIPVDDRGNHLKQVKVLHVEDYSEQEELIRKIKLTVNTAPKYDVNDTGIYIDKKSMIIDGANYTTFLSKCDSMLDYISNRKSTLEYDEVVLFIGEPRRMLPLYPINVNNGFCENFLVVSPISECMATTSVMMSLAQSIGFRNKEISVWTTKKNEVYRQMIVESQQSVSSVRNELIDICSEIKKIKSLIENKIEGDKYIFIFGTETLLMDMSYQVSSQEATSFEHSSTYIEKRGTDEMDLNTLLASLGGGNAASDVTPNNVILHTSSESELISAKRTNGVSEYDASNDLKFILTQGPRLGYHFVVLFNTAGELSHSKLDTSIFKHKILFRMSKTDAMEIIGSSGASVISELNDHSFRYTNGIEALSFRPYLHPGLSWDGWSMGGCGNVLTNEEEYLM